MENSTGSLILIVICIILSAYFSATETSFSSLNKIKMKNLAAKGNKRAELVLKLADDFDGLLSTILIGNNIVNIACSSLFTVLFVRMMGEQAGAGMSTLLTTVIVLIFGEISPKSIAKEFPEKFAMVSAPAIRAIMLVMTPLNFLFRMWKKLILLLFKTTDDKSITEEELLMIVEEAEQDGGIGCQEGALIRNAIEFSEVEACEIMIPRTDMVAVSSATTDYGKISKLFRESGFSRLPVYEETRDHIAGILHQKDFYAFLAEKREKDGGSGNENEEADIRSIMKPAVFVPETNKIGNLLKELQRQNLHMAVVVDEFGGTSGIVTMEDILEELVGDIWDEHDKVVYDVEQLSGREYLILGSAGVDKLLEIIGTEDDMDMVTVSGWVTEIFERIPREGEKLVYDNCLIEIVKASGHRVDKIKVTVDEGEKETESEE